MRKSRKAVSVRVDAEDYKYLKLLALNDCQAIAGAISTVISTVKKPTDYLLYLEGNP